MSLDFQSIRQQVHQLGDTATLRERELGEKKALALSLLESYSQDLESMQQKIRDVVQSHDPSLRCAMPVAEALTYARSLPGMPGEMTLLATDGSQISPDRHAEVNFAVVNVGAIQMRLGSREAPATSITSQLLYDEDLYSDVGTISEESLALKRDWEERKVLGNLAAAAQPPVMALTDGPLELWGVKGADSAQRSDFQDNLKQYQESLEHLASLDVITSGYVDKPGANLVVRMLEVAITPQSDLADIKKLHPLRGVADTGLYKELLAPGERSAVFAIQSQSAKSYQGALKLHFYYLNVGQVRRPYIARVEIPAWVAENQENLDSLHAVLVHQCRVMGTRPYPYLLHRAHETAVVKRAEKEQVTAMITQELRQRGISVSVVSSKQSAKQSEGRGRYGR